MLESKIKVIQSIPVFLSEALGHGHLVPLGDGPKLALAFSGYGIFGNARFSFHSRLLRPPSRYYENIEVLGPYWMSDLIRLIRLDEDYTLLDVSAMELDRMQPKSK